jgi:cytochrome d ubiquinol oxidase subunit II
LLVSTGDPAHSLTIANAAASQEGLRTALSWFLPGFSLVLAYSVYVYRCFRGKVVLPEGE